MQTDNTQKEIIKDQEFFVVKSCKYCKLCLKCNKLHTYRDEFKEEGFWTFNKDVKYWNVYNLDWSDQNEIFKLEPLRKYSM